MVYQESQWDETVVVHHFEHALICDLCGTKRVWRDGDIPPINGWFTSKEGLHYCSDCDDKRVRGMQIMAQKAGLKSGRPRGSKNKKVKS